MAGKTVKRWVCDACGAIHFVEIAEARGKCPTCSGQGHERECTVNDAGVVTPKHE